MVPRPVLTHLLLQRFNLHVTIKKNRGTNSKTKHSTSARCMHSLSDLSVLVTPLRHTCTHSRSDYSARALVGFVPLILLRSPTKSLQKQRPGPRGRAAYPLRLLC